MAWKIINKKKFAIIYFFFHSSCNAIRWYYICNKLSKWNKYIGYSKIATWPTVQSKLIAFFPMKFIQLEKYIIISPLIIQMNANFDGFDHNEHPSKLEKSRFTKSKQQLLIIWNKKKWYQWRRDEDIFRNSFPFLQAFYFQIHLYWQKVPPLQFPSHHSMWLFVFVFCTMPSDLSSAEKYSISTRWVEKNATSSVYLESQMEFNSFSFFFTSSRSCSRWHLVESLYFWFIRNSNQ